MRYVQYVVEFFNHPFFIIVGGVSTALVVVAFLYGILCWGFGITPIIFRLGTGLWERKVAIFADADAYASLEATLIDSGIFRGKNIVHITTDNIDKAKDETIFLVDWESFGKNIDRVFAARRNYQTSVVIYAKPGSVPPDRMAVIANNANTVVVNFRGRLLNDILTSLMTTSYEKK